MDISLNNLESRGKYMKRILSFSACMLLALSLTAGNTTVSAKCASEEDQWHVAESSEEIASEDLEESRVDDSDEDEVEALATPVATEVPEEAVAKEDEAVNGKAAPVVVVPATEAPATENSQSDNRLVQEDYIDVNATALEATEEGLQEEAADTESEEIPAEDDVIPGVPPVIAEEPAEENVDGESGEVTEDEETVTLEEDDIANSGVKKDIVQENTKKSQKVQETVKTVTKSASTTAELPQTGVLSENVFYILGSLICALGVCTLAFARRRTMR